MERLRVDIEGMTCGHCVRAVERSLGALPGLSVDSVRVGSADVSFDPTMTDRNAILGAVGEAGYAAHIGAATTP